MSSEAHNDSLRSHCLAVLPRRDHCDHTALHLGSHRHCGISRKRRYLVL